MLQAVMIEPGCVEIEFAELPMVNKNEVLIKMQRIGVCGSDIHVYHGRHPYTAYPVIQGHEVSGLVAACGPGVKGFAVGDKVTLTPQITCGTCYPCTHGMPHICESLKVLGFQVPGAARELFAVDAGKVVKVPAAMTLDQAAMVEPTAVAVHALERAGMVLNGANVLVLGAGPIGNLTAQAAKALGAAKVMITDIVDYKLRKARECGIDLAVHSGREEMDKVITHNFGAARADLIMECVGVQHTIAQAIDLARKGTTIVVVGVFGEQPLVNLGLVQDRELTLRGTLMYLRRDYEKAIELIAGDCMRLASLITHRFPFREYQAAYEAIENANGQYMKVMIDLDE